MPVRMKTAVAAYQIVSSPCPVEDLSGSVVYGIRAVHEEEEAVVIDISTDKEVVLKLIGLLQKGEVSPDQLYYIVEDYIDDLYAY